MAPQTITETSFKANADWMAKWLRSPRGLKWAVPVALVATPAYLGLTALAIEFAARPGLGFLNVLVFLFFWNAAKFAWMAVLSVPLRLRNA